MKSIALLVYAASICLAMKVAVTGTTGRLGREAVQILSSKGIQTRCLLRHPIDASVSPSIEKDASSSEVASYLANLPHVTMVEGDATDPTSCRLLVEGCDAVLALHGPVRPPPLQSLFRLLPETDPKHSRSVNYLAVKNLIDAARECDCKRIVRVTGKGEAPTQVFTVLINMLGHMAKAWNYEGEQLLRTSGVDYTIVRPGVMGRDDVPTGGRVLALADNGRDLPVTAVTHSQIAGLCVDCLDYPNTSRSTLTAMNVASGTGEDSYAPLLAGVKSDTRSFPTTLLSEHKKAAQIGAAVLVAFAAVILTGFAAMTKAIGGLVVGLLS